MMPFLLEDKPEDRRAFLSRMATLAGVSVVSIGRALDAVVSADYTIARLKTDTGDWYADMKGKGLADGAELNLMKAANKSPRFNLIGARKETVIEVKPELLKKYSLFYLTGHQKFALPMGADKHLAKVLKRGGMLLMDDCGGTKNNAFDATSRSYSSKMFPNHLLKPIPMEHDMFQTPFKIKEVLGGDKRLDPFLEGVLYKKRIPLIYTRNDLGCAWEGHECAPGGEEQRTNAFQIGINLIFYSLTS
jgi:Domain of unknown function (DUF4159)